MSSAKKGALADRLRAIEEKYSSNSRKPQPIGLLSKNYEVIQPQDSPSSLKSLSHLVAFSTSRSGEKAPRPTHESYSKTKLQQKIKVLQISSDTHDFAWRAKTIYLIKLKRSLRLRAEPELYIQKNHSLTKSVHSIRSDSLQNTENPSILDTKRLSVADMRDYPSVEASLISLSLERSSTIKTDHIDGYLIDHARRYVGCKSRLACLQPASSLRSETGNLDHSSYKSALRNSPTSRKSSQKQVTFSDSLRYLDDGISSSQSTTKIDNDDRENIQMKINQKQLADLVAKQRSMQLNCSGEMMIDVKQAANWGQRKDGGEKEAGGEGGKDWEEEVGEGGVEKRFVIEKSKAKVGRMEAGGSDERNLRDGQAKRLGKDSVDRWWFDDSFLKLVREVISQKNNSMEGELLKNQQITMGTETRTYESLKPSNLTSSKEQVTEKNTINDTLNALFSNETSTRAALYNFRATLNAKKRPKRLPPPPLRDTPQTPLPLPSILDDLTECRSQISRLLQTPNDQNSVFYLSRDDSRSVAKDMDAKTEKWPSPETGKQSAFGARSTAGRLDLTEAFLRGAGHGLKTSTRKNSAKKMDIDRFEIDDESPEDFKRRSLNNSERKEDTELFKKRYLNNLKIDPIALNKSDVYLDDQDLHGVEWKVSENQGSSDYFDTFRDGRLEMNNETSKKNQHNPNHSFSCRDMLKKTISQNEDRYLDSPHINHSHREGYTNRSVQQEKGSSVKPNMYINQHQIDFPLMEELSSPISLNSSGISPIQHFERALNPAKAARHKPSFHLQGLTEKIDEIDSREVSPRQRTSNPTQTKLNEPTLNLETTSFNMFVPGKSKEESAGSPKKSEKSAFNHQRLTGLIATQLQGIEEGGHQGVNDKIGLITNQLVNIFDKMHRLGEEEDFESVVHSVEKKHSEEYASQRNLELIRQTSEIESIRDTKSVPRSPKSIKVERSSSGLLG